MVHRQLGKQSAGDSPLRQEAPGGPAPLGASDVVARLCLWIDVEGDVRQWSLDAWNSDWELETIYVVPLGPFDNPGLGSIISDALGEFMQRGLQLRLPL